MCALITLLSYIYVLVVAFELVILTQETLGIKPLVNAKRGNLDLDTNLKELAALLHVVSYINGV